MKVIDLLNQIAKGEIPRRIIYDKYIYQWNNIIENYEREVDINTTLNWDYIVINCLNELVEILEEEKKLPEKISIKKEHYNEYIEDYCFKNIPLENLILNQNEVVIIDKINEIIDYLHYLKSKGE